MKEGSVSYSARDVEYGANFAKLIMLRLIMLWRRIWARRTEYGPSGICRYSMNKVAEPERSQGLSHKACFLQIWHVECKIYAEESSLLPSPKSAVSDAYRYEDLGGSATSVLARLYRT